MSQIVNFLSQIPASAPATSQPAPSAFVFLQQFGPLILIVIVFYFIFIRGKQKTDKQRQDLLGNLKKGDKIQTIGGILGTVIDVRESEVLVKVDESSNAKIRFSRNAIHRVITDDAKTEMK